MRVKLCAIIICLVICIITSISYADNPVKNFTAEVLAPHKVILNWDRIENNKDSLLLVYEREGNPYYNYIEVKGNTFSFNWLIPGSNYRFWIGNVDEDPNPGMYEDASRYISLPLPMANTFKARGYNAISAVLYRHDDVEDWNDSKKYHKASADKLSAMLDVIDKEKTAYYSFVVRYVLPIQVKESKVMDGLWVLHTPQGYEYFSANELKFGEDSTLDGYFVLPFNDCIKTMLHYSNKIPMPGKYVLSLYLNGSIAAEQEIIWRN